MSSTLEVLSIVIFITSPGFQPIGVMVHETMRNPSYRQSKRRIPFLDTGITPWIPSPGLSLFFPIKPGTAAHHGGHLLLLLRGPSHHIENIRIGTCNRVETIEHHLIKALRWLFIVYCHVARYAK